MNVGKIGHTAEQEIFLKAGGNGCIRRNRAVQLNKLTEREGVNDKFHIPAAQIAGEFSGQKLGIGAGDVDITVQRNAERVNALFPVRHFLNFI